MEEYGEQHEYAAEYDPYPKKGYGGIFQCVPDHFQVGEASCRGDWMHDWNFLMHERSFEPNARGTIHGSTSTQLFR
jgi:hypothetical protein